MNPPPTLSTPSLPNLTLPPPPPTTKTMTISRRYNLHFHAVPYIRLSGHWLDDTGFHIGDKIDVQVEPERLTITKPEPKATEPTPPTDTTGQQLFDFTGLKPG